MTRKFNPIWCERCYMVITSTHVKRHFKVVHRLSFWFVVTKGLQVPDEVAVGFIVFQFREQFK
jgi:hypothetical protein